MSFKIPIFQPQGNIESLILYLNELFRRWAGSNLLKKSELDIGSWDMGSISNITIDYDSDLDFKRVVSIDILIINDTQDKRYSASLVKDGIESCYIDSSNVNITRLSGGFFDGSDFNDPSLSNRGKVILWYTV